MTMCPPTQAEFPRELLSQLASARLAYFQSKVVVHPHLKEAHHALLTAIRRPAGASLILVFGPTGVGKTTLRLRIEQVLLEEARVAMLQDVGYIPVIGLEAVAPEAGDFKWKDFYTRALTALDEPLMAQKINYGVRNIRRDGAGQLLVGHQVVAFELRWALEQALRHRHPLALMIDEAQHFKKIASGRRLLDQMDTLKSLAGVSGTLLVLVGTYELLGLADLSAQLNRRSIEVHFPRYRPDEEQEITAFKSVLLTFQRHLPLYQEADLVGGSEYFYERSVGCVGVLKDWLTRALAAVLEEGQEKLTHKHLERHAIPTRKLLRMAREIKEGEEAFMERDVQQAELRMLLGLPEEPQPANDPRLRTSVGQRKPGRDPVGQDGYVG